MITSIPNNYICGFRSIKFFCRTFLSLILPVLFILACTSTVFAQTKVYGDSATMGAGVVKVWVEINSESKPLRIGVSLSEAALTNLPNSYISHSLNFPVVASDSLFKHVYFNWNPHGHQPNNIYTLPHYDFHFYYITRQERLQIPGGYHYVPIDPKFMPQDYIFVPGLENFSLAQMGVHYVDSLAPELNGNTFTNTLIYGFYNGKKIFIEPMVTTDYLASLPNVVLPVKQPAAFQKTGYYPTSYEIYHNSSEGVMEFILKDLVYREGVISVQNIGGEIPEDFTLFQNFPNPFNPDTKIQFSIPASEFVTLKVFDATGREVANLVNQNLTVGTYEYSFNAERLTSGVYFYTLTAGDFRETKKMLLVK